MKKSNKIPEDYRKNLKKKLGVGSHRDIDKNKLIPILKDIFFETIEELSEKYNYEGEKPSLINIYICGSFARNDAVKNASDLDLRFVVDNFKCSDEFVIDFREKMKKKWVKKYKYDTCFVGIDAWIGPSKPAGRCIKIE